MAPKIFMSLNTKTTYYKDAVQHCGGICCGGYCEPFTDNVAEEHDGLLLCGGVDIHPRYYGEEIAGSKNIDEARDAYEMALLDAFVKAGKPVLGICRGHQLINVYFGGTLTQHIATSERHTADEDLVHEVTAVPGLAPDHILTKLYGETFPVNSAHHQAVAIPGRGLQITHTSLPDSIPEALIHTSLPILSIQWHPERTTLSRHRDDTVDGLGIFEWFLGVCEGERDVF